MKSSQHWIPFIPVRDTQEDPNHYQVRLQRASLPRIPRGLPTRRIRPRSSLLQYGLDDAAWRPFYLFEEEVPRSGAIVEARWKRARGFDGSVQVWYARRKTNGGGEGVGRLKFDQLVEK